MVERDAVAGWLARYIGAWKSYEASAIGDLFTEDAEYRYHPNDDPVVGRDAIVASWTEPDAESGASGRDDPGTYEASYAPYAVDGDRAVAVGWSRYWTDATRTVGKAVYDNCFVLEFAPDGRCRRFTEWFMQRRNT